MYVVYIKSTAAKLSVDSAADAAVLLLLQQFALGLE